MSRLTTLEQECQAVLLSIRDLWTLSPHRTSVNSFMDIMGELRRVLKHLENKEFGCAMGVHASPCQCKEGVREYPNRDRH